MNERVPAIRYLALAAAALSASPALAETTVGGVVALNGGYGSNPQLITGPSGGGSTATGVATFSPVITFAGPRTTANINGNLSYTYYSKNYNDQTDYTIGGTVSQQLSPTSSALLGGRYSRRTLTALDALTDPVTGLPPDPTLIVNGGRKVEQFSANAGYNTRLSTRYSLEVHGDTSATNYLNESLAALGSSDVVSYGGGFSVTGQVSRRVQLGGGLDVRKTDYKQNLFGDGTQYTPTLIANVQLSPTIKLAANGGVTFIKIDSVAGVMPGSNSTTLSGSVSLCQTRPRTTMCVNVRRTVSPTTYAGSSTVTVAGASYQYATSPRGSATANLNYSRSQALSGPLRNDYSYLEADAGYRHQVTQRLSATANARYVNPINSRLAQKSNFYANIGISYRLGRAQ